MVANKISGTWLRHLSIACACAIWGLMAPLAKDAMQTAFSGLDMVSFRVTGGALCFWLTSAVLTLTGRKQEHVPRRDIGLFFVASLCSITCNQCLYTVGISYTSPVNASIMTTMLPVISLILSALILKERVSWYKVLGIAVALSGALMVILTSHTASAAPVADPLSDALGAGMCVLAQCSFALYLVLFSKLIQRYSIVTCMKWMMLFAALTVLPFTTPHLLGLPWQTIALKSYLEAGFVAFFGTFVAYILMTIAQRALRPTQVAIYNYFQPVIASLVSVAMGLSVFGWLQAVAILLVFVGVYFVTFYHPAAERK
ncbi:MAG: DMT family transporter [Paludibacteraceae bacterium]